MALSGEVGFSGGRKQQEVRKKMLTIFTMPKAFRGHIEVIQRNAITSWTKLEPRPEIVLFGGDEGTAEVAGELGLRYEAEVARNDQGTPLVSGLFRKAEKAASFPCLCYVNADIILLSDFVRAVARTQEEMPKSLMVSKRIDLDIRERLEFGADWEARVRQRVEESGEHGHYSAIDAFMYPKGMYPKIPDFAIGRLWWDQWFIKSMRERKLPVIDASLVAQLLHQRHDYNHVAGGEEQVWRGAEAKTNFGLYGGVEHAYTLLDATHELMPDGTIRRVRFRKPAFQVKNFAWDLLVKRTARARHAVGLRRKVLDAGNKPTA